MKENVVICHDGVGILSPTSMSQPFWKFVDQALKQAGHGTFVTDSMRSARDACSRGQDLQRNFVIYFSASMLKEAKDIVGHFRGMEAVIFASRPEDVTSSDGVTILPETQEGIAQLIELINAPQPATAS
ncbi:MAG: hypothetical protein PHU42_00395 [Patescibacteria group bacterium]|nr:hypothetical protein [Patescibacteria group bacterium]